MSLHIAQHLYISFFIENKSENIPGGSSPKKSDKLVLFAQTDKRATMKFPLEYFRAKL
jgi:hypothetical protein